MTPWTMRPAVKGLAGSIHQNPESWEQRGAFWMLHLKNSKTFAIEFNGVLGVKVRTICGEWKLSLREKLALYIAILFWLDENQDYEHIADQEFLDDLLRWVDRLVACGYDTEQHWLQKQRIPARLTVSN